MPDLLPPEERATRDADGRAADHAAIDRLTGELLPALIAKLGVTGLGELEVREGAWRVRLRRPASAVGSGVRDRRVSDRGAGDRPTERGPERPPRAQHLHRHPEPPTSGRTDSRSVATSPAVGVYQPRKDLTVGSRVRAGDPLGRGRHARRAPRRWWRRSTASSGRAWWSRATPSSTARS